jgi:predicted acetyltransferase
MSAQKPLPPGIEVLLAEAAQEPVVANLLELYAHDFSEFIDLQLQPDGRFGYPGLSRYWREDGCVPLLVRVDGQLAGCVLIAKGSRISADPQVWDMAEFFIVRGHRRRGLGAAVAHEIWRAISPRRHSGKPQSIPLPPPRPRSGSSRCTTSGGRCSRS